MGRYSLEDKYNEEKKKSGGAVTRYSLEDKYNENRQYENTDTSGVNDDFINTFISDANKFFKGTEDTYKGIGWGNASSVYDSTNSTWQDLKKRQDTIKAWLYKNKSNLTEDSYKSLFDAMNSIDGSANSVLKGFEDAKKFYGQWETEDAYNQWQANEDWKKEFISQDDFGEYVQKGKDMAGDGRIAEIFGKPVGTDNYIEYYRNLYGDQEWYKDGKYAGKVSNSASVALAMTEDEVKIYDYYLAKYGKDKANEYLDSLQDTINQRIGGHLADNFEEANLKWLMSINAGVDQFASGVKNLDNFFKGTEADPISAVQYASASVRDSIESEFWKGAYDLGVTISNQLPSILVGTLTGGVGGLATMGSSVLGNSYAEMRNLGYDELQSRGYAVLVTAAEVGLQAVLGGISSLGGSKSLSKMAVNALDSVDNGIARVALKLGTKMISEGFEEAAQEVLNPIFKSIVGGKWEGVDWGEVAYSGLLGALSAGMLESVGTVASDVVTTKTGKKVQKAGAVSRLTELGKTFSADTVANQIAEKVNEKTGAYKIGRLFQEVGATLSEQNVADIMSGLEARGIPNKQAKKLAKQYQAFLNGEMELTDERVAILENCDPLTAAIREKLINENLTSYQMLQESVVGRGSEAYKRAREYDDIIDLIKNGGNVETKTATPLAVLSKDGFTLDNSNVDDARRNVYSHSNDGKAYLRDTNEEITIREIKSIKDGRVNVVLDDGREVSIDDIDFSNNDEALIYEAVADMNPETARDLIEGFNQGNTDEGKSISFESYLRGFNEAYRYGSVGIPVAEMSGNGFSADLSDAQRQIAYNRGKADAIVKVKADQAKVDGAKNAQTTKKSGRVTYLNGAKPTGNRQKSAVKAIEVLSGAIGNNWYVFSSYVENGVRVYKDKDGKVKPAPNGKYDTATGDIYIDLNAGNNGEGLMVFTMAHELTHFIRQWSPEKFKVFADFLLEQYGAKGESVEQLIQKKIARAKERNKELSYDHAYEEVIADSCESMLRDSNAIEAIAKLKAKDATIWEKIKSFISKLVAKIRAAYAKLNPDSKEGQMVLEMKEAAEKLQALWTEALVDAGETYRAINDMVQVDTDSQSASPMLSERTWTESEYVQARDEAAEKLAKAIGVSKAKALAYIDDVNSIAKMIADNRTRLDYDASPFGSAFVSNSEYGGSFDFTTLCKKRRLYTGTFSEIQKSLKDVALTPDDILKIRNMMIARGEEATCGLCYVEGSRANMGKFAKEFIRLYKRDNPNAWDPTMADVNTPDGVESMKINHPKAYEQYEYFWNHYGKLKDSDPALFASQQKPKLYEARKEYKGEILKAFKNDSTVEKKNLNGGIRMQSFSDFEIVHMIDTMQIIMDMASVGLAGQAYTKVVEFAEAFGNTGLKINLSLIAKGVDENGNLIFDDREGMAHNEAFRLRDKYSANVGTIIVTFTDEQLLAAMADPRIDFIIPFHRSQWKKTQYGAMGLPKGTKDYTFMQNEKLIKQTYHEYRGKLVKDKASNYMPNEYWDFSKSGKENAEAYLKMCAENNKRPKFYKLLDYDGKGTYSLKKDGSTDGYWKLLIDFKMYDNNGVGSPQKAVVPNFSMKEATHILDEYRGGHQSYPVANDVVDAFVADYQKGNDVKYSDRDSAGNQLTEEQQEFFKDSKVRDEKGRLKVMYHGTNTPNFTVFDTSFSDDKISLFFTDSPSVADSYTTKQSDGRNVDPYRLPNTIKTMEDYNRYMDDNGLPYRIIQVTGEVIEKAKRDIEEEIGGDEKLSFYRDTIFELESLKGKFIHYNGGVNYITRSDMVYTTAEQAIQSEVNDSYWVPHRFGNRYAVYLNMKNPYILDAGKHHKGIGDLEIKVGMDDAVARFDINGEDIKVVRGYGESFEDFAKRFLSKNEAEKFLRMVEAEREKFIQKEMEVDGWTREKVVDFWKKHGNVETGDFTYKAKNASLDYHEAGHWKHLEYEGYTGTTRDLSKWAYIKGYDGVIIKNLKDIGGYSGGFVSNASTIAIAFNSNQVKSTNNKKPTSDPDIRYSDRVTDKETLDFLENQEHVTVYRAMQLIDGKLYPPMNAYTKDENGNKVLVTPSEIGTWEQSVERPDLIDPKTGKFKLDKGKVDGGKQGTVVPAAYNPYIHTSLSMLNDQFTSAYQRSNLVVVKGVVPKSELTSGYKAQFAKDSVGETEWHSGVVSTQLPESRKVILSRWFKPVEVMDNDVVAQNIKEMLGDTGIEIPYNVVSPKLRRSLEKIGVPIGEGRGIRNLPKKDDVKYSDRDLAPTFYSQMGKVIDGMKQDKFGANSVIPMLRGRGVKAEEIRWSGIATWLEGKKSVTKQELMEFIQGSQLQIGEKEISGDNRQERWESFYRRMNDVIPYFSTEEVEEMCFDYDGDFSAKQFERELKEYVEDGTISEDAFDEAMEYAEEMDEALKASVTKWSKYKLEGGSNYREILFEMPNSSYTNNAMRAHWGEKAKGVLAHARIQDFVTADGKMMLFIEEIQSDWHNYGKKNGYRKEGELTDAQIRVESDKAYEKFWESDITTSIDAKLQDKGYFNAPVLFGNLWDGYSSIDSLERIISLTSKEKAFFESAIAENRKRMKQIETAPKAGSAIDAPFKDTYHEYVLKRLLRMAAEEGYDCIGWTPADIQSKRWSDEYAEAYRIEYDQDIPKFLKKYGRQWGAKVELGGDHIMQPDTLGYEDEAVAVWSMDITDSMKDSVLHEGQVLYSDRETLSQAVNDLATISDEAYLEAKKTKPYVLVMERTPQIILDTMSEGKDRKILIRRDALYLAIRKNGVQEGHYHGLGEEVLAHLPKYLEDPDTIISTETNKNRRIVLTHIPTKNGQAMLSIEFESLKEFENKYDYFNLIVTVFDYRKNYLKNLFEKYGAEVVYEKEDLTQVNPQLHEWLSIVNAKSSNNSIRQQVEYVKQNSKNSENSQKLSERDTDSVSNRSLLANALETAAQSDIEKNKLAQYKKKIELIEQEEVRLHEIRRQIRNLSFSRGIRSTELLKKLRFNENQTANRINTYDRQLLTLEASKPLKAVLEREKKLAYKKAEQKGKEALNAYREKAAQTTRELMNRYQESRARGVENRNKTDIRHKIKKVVGDLNQLLLRPTKDKHIKEELRTAVAEALSAINMDTIGADERVAKYNALIAKTSDPDMVAELVQTRDRIELQGAVLRDKLTALQTAYEKIKNSTDPELKNAYQETVMNAIKNVVDKVGNTSIRDMNLTQLEAVYEMYSMILHTVRTANKAFKAKKGETITQLAETVNAEIRKVGKEKFTRNPVIAGLRKVGWTLLKPLYAFRTIGSDTFTGMYDNLRSGEDIYYVDINEAKGFVQAQYKKHNYKSWDLKQTKTFTAKSGKTFTLTLEQMMSLYAYSRRDQAHDHIIEGGIVLENSVIETRNKLGLPVKYKVDTKSAFNISEETLDKICNSLTNEQRAFVEEMQTYLSDVMGAKGNEVSMELLGVKLFKEKFYFPLKSSKYYMGFKPEEAGEIKLKSPAFSKETVQHANNPVVLKNFTDVWATHINDMSMYHAFVLPLEDFTRVYNYKTKTDANLETVSTEATIANAFGEGATQYIRNFLRSLNGGVRTESVGIADKAVSLSKKGAVLGSASVMIQQPSAIMRAMAHINPIHFVASTHKSINLAKHNKDWAELKQYAPIAGIKEMGRFDVGMGQSTVKWIKDQNTILENADEILSKAPAFMDEVTWVGIWNAVKNEVKHQHKDLAVDSEEYLKKCGERFTEVISLTQVYDSVFSRSDIMRNPSWIAKALTAFMAEPSTTLNMLVDAFIQGKRTGKVGGFVKTTASTSGAILGAIVLNAALKSIITAMRDDDEDESYVEKYLGAFVGNATDDLNPLGYIPFVKDVVSIFKGYDVERMDMALFSDFKQAIDAFDSESKMAYEKWSGLVGAISAFFGVPFKNVERDIRGAINTIKSFSEGEQTTGAGIKESIRESLTGDKDSNSRQLYEAIISGDQAQIDKVKGRFKDQDAIDSAIKKALRENDSRIREAAQARMDGDIAGYTRIAREIINEGFFKQDYVVGAINAEISALKREQEEQEVTTEETTDVQEDEVTSIYKGNDINVAFDNGDTALAHEIIQDLIDTKVANGMEEKNARSSVRSSMTSYWKPLYKQAYQNGDTAEMYRIRTILLDSGLYGTANEVVKTVQNWLRD